MSFAVCFFYSKKRFVPPVTLGKKIVLFQELKYEEEAMKYLSKPYITEVCCLHFYFYSSSNVQTCPSQSQENQYLQSTGQSHPEYWDDFTRRPIEMPLKQVYAADFLEKLNVSRNFQEED